MNDNFEKSTAAKYRLMGAGLILLACVMFRLRPPGGPGDQRRGIVWLLADFGYRNAVTNLMLIISWAGFVILLALGAYQLITGRRLSFLHM